MQHPLFPADLPELEWRTFRAAGYTQPVAGVVYTSDRPPCCGVPVGGLGTGCLDVDARGIWGWSSIFHPVGPHPLTNVIRLPRKVPAIHAIVGLSVGGTTWVLASPGTQAGGEIEWCTEPYGNDGAGKIKPIRLKCPAPRDVRTATGIRYWGHYPVADLEYQTDAPVVVSLRAWAPFIPGDAVRSGVPAGVFEVTIRNPTRETQSGAVAFNFPGPDAAEARATTFHRVLSSEPFEHTTIESDGGVSYTVALLGGTDVRFGAGLDTNPRGWAEMGKTLPAPVYQEAGGRRVATDASVSAASGFRLAAGETTTVRFLLCWHAPIRDGVTKTWDGRDELMDGKLRFRWEGPEEKGGTHTWAPMYTTRYGGSVDVARRMVTEHEDLWRRVAAWQSEVYADTTLPPWLQDSLVNNLALIAETSHWAQPRAPLGDWAFPGGVFALDESPRGCPHMACIPCDWYGNLPIVYFFPELALSTLRAFAAYQAESGEIPFALGKIDLPDFAAPEYFWQVSLNGFCYADMVDRVWRTTGDDAVLGELYDSVKRSTRYVMGLSRPPRALRMPDVGGMEWFEFGAWAGMTTHAGGLRLAGLLMTERMARAMGDAIFERECRGWFDEGVTALEGELWADGYYLNYWEPETGKKSDDVMGYQLDGEWAARFHGLPGVFRPDRVKATLATIRRINEALTPEVGAANFARPDRTALPADSPVAFYGRYTMFTAELLVLAYTHVYAGDREHGLELARKHWANLVLTQKHTWDLPNMVEGQGGTRWFGTDYSQIMMLWAFPAVLAGADLDHACGEGSLVRKVIEAGR